MEELLARARHRDEKVAKIAIGAEPAGEADPYKAPREDDPESDEEVEESSEIDSSKS
jgi:ribosome-binding factor A